MGGAAPHCRLVGRHALRRRVAGARCACGLPQLWRFLGNTPRCAFKQGVRALLQACHYFGSLKLSFITVLEDFNACSKSSEVKAAAERHFLEQLLHAGGCSLLGVKARR